MKVLLDDLPRRLAAALAGHEVKTVPQAGWASIKNGELLRLAESQFDVLVTVDRNMSCQQNLVELRIAVVVLCTQSNRFQDLLPLVPRVLAALMIIQRGELVKVSA